MLIKNSDTLYAMLFELYVTNLQNKYWLNQGHRTVKPYTCIKEIFLTINP